MKNDNPFIQDPKSQGESSSLSENTSTIIPDDDTASNSTIPPSTDLDSVGLFHLKNDEGHSLKKQKSQDIVYSKLAQNETSPPQKTASHDSAAGSYPSEIEAGHQSAVTKRFFSTFAEKTTGQVKFEISKQRYGTALKSVEGDHNIAYTLFLQFICNANSTLKCNTRKYLSP